MAISPFVKALRERVGHDLLVLPSVSVLPRDDAGRLLLVRLVDTGNWATIGGAIEPDESPEEAARREAEEEAGVSVRLGPLLGVLGGPEYRVTYPNGDRTAYVVVVFDATVVSGTPRGDGDETTDAAWFDLAALPFGQMGPLTRALLRAVGVGPGGE
jgi:8-oxo-dGTP pyrophosphatase MutT (NUDIX family)